MFRERWKITLSFLLHLFLQTIKVALGFPNGYLFQVAIFGL